MKENSTRLFFFFFWANGNSLRLGILVCSFSARILSFFFWLLHAFGNEELLMVVLSNEGETLVTFLRNGMGPLQTEPTMNYLMQPLKLQISYFFVTGGVLKRGGQEIVCFLI